MHADLYEIAPEEPYTDADLNYNDDNSRTTTEMNDPLARPAIAGSVENMDQYDVVFVGYPIWWGEAPRIISTFMEIIRQIQKYLIDGIYMNIFRRDKLKVTVIDLRADLNVACHAGRSYHIINGQGRIRL